MRWHLVIGTCPLCGTEWFADAVLKWPAPEIVRDVVIKKVKAAWAPRIDKHLKDHADELLAEFEKGES